MKRDGEDGCSEDCVTFWVLGVMKMEEIKGIKWGIFLFSNFSGRN